MTAERDTIRDKVEQLAEALVLAEPDDLQALADLHGRFQEIALLADEGHAPIVAGAARAAADLIESIVLEEVADPAVAMQTVAQTVSALQEIVRDGRDPAKVTFPAGLPAEFAPDGMPHPASPPAHIDPKLFAEFIARQDPVMDEMQQLVLALEKTSGEDNLLALRRLLHTLKAEAALLGLADVERLCHITEDLLGNVQGREAADALLNVKDSLVQLFHACAGRGAMPGGLDHLLKPLPPAPADVIELSGGQLPAESPASGSEPPGKAGPAQTPPVAPDASGTITQGDRKLLEDFVSEAGEHLEAADAHLLALETVPWNPEGIHAVFRAFHTIKGVAGCLGLDQIRQVAHEAESLLDRARRNELSMTGPPIDVSFEAVDTLRRLLQNLRQALSTGRPVAADPDVPALLTRIADVAAGRISAPAVQKMRTAEDHPDADTGPQPGVPHRPAPKEPVAAEHVSPVKETVRVDADRLDRLLDTIGELVIVESMFSRSPELRRVASADLLRHLALLDKITRELRESAMSLRMVPIRATFQKMARLVRDLSKKSNKPVDFVTRGEDTELDRTIIDRIGDPLVHMVRNAVDHGLEAGPDQRRRAGKPEAGRIELRAFHKGGSIYIEVADDGRGLDRQAILDKAIERGLVRPDEPLNDQQVWNLIFLPGLSTARTVTDVSGRGVGMDVVKRNVEQLRGQVEIQTTPGKGTTFSIRLPLTLAIIDGMVIRVGAQRYVIPTPSIVGSIRPEPGDVSTVPGRGERMRMQDRQIPLLRLGQLFKVADAEPDAARAFVVVVEDDGRQVGLLADELLGRQQIVIKSLGETMQGIPGLAGGAIMPDGHVGLILDIGGLIRLAQSDE